MDEFKIQSPQLHHTIKKRNSTISQKSSTISMAKQSKNLLFQMKHSLFTTLSSSTLSQDEANFLSSENKQVHPDVNKPGMSKEKMEKDRKRLSDYSMSSNYFKSMQGRVSNVTTKTHSAIEYSTADIVQLPSIRVNGPIEQMLRDMLSPELYLHFGFCMGHPKYFPGDSTSTDTMPWPSYDPVNSNEVAFEHTNSAGFSMGLSEYSEQPLVPKAATLNGIIHTLACKGTTDNELLNDFIRTYHYSATGHDLLRICFARYLNCYFSKKNQEGNEEWHSIIQLKILNIIKKWVYQYQSIMFNDPDLMEFTKLILLHIDKYESTKGKFVAPILAELEAKAPQHQTRQTYEPISALAGLCDILNFEVLRPTALKVTFVDLDPKIFAQQLTLIEHKLFCIIQPEEMYHQTWNDKDHREFTSQNLWSLIQMFNRVANFVSNEILNCPTLNERVEIIQRFIRVAKYCYKFRNFNSAFEVMAGLNVALIGKLNRTWQSVSGKDKRSFRKLNFALSTKDNYKQYRDLINQYLPPTEPSLPFVGVSLTDLVFTENGNLTYIPFNPMMFQPSPTVPYVSISKLRLISKIITNLLMFQSLAYNFEESTSLQSWILQNILSKPCESTPPSSPTNSSSTSSSTIPTTLSMTDSVY